MALKIFISYSREDSRDFVNGLFHQIRDHSQNTPWIDLKIPGGVRYWWQSICENIESADIFLYVLTPKSLESIYCRAEVQYALALNKPILPVMHRECVVPDFLTHINYKQIPDDVNFTMQDAYILVSEGITDINGVLIHDSYRPDAEKVYAPRTAPRPIEPKPTPDPVQIEAVFEQGEEALEANNLPLAKRFFKQVVQIAPDSVLGETAADLLDDIAYEVERKRLYDDIVQRVKEGKSMRIVRRLWANFQARYPDHDPRGVGPYLARKPTPPKHQSPPVKSGSSAGSQPPPAPPPTRTKPRSTELLPAPFAWVEIPAGDVTLITKENWAENYIPKGESRTFDVATFHMSKYAVTNAQYAKFIEAGGYKTEKWWTDAGWKLRGEEKWTEPRSWKDERFNGAEQPVMGVSWYEAVAFCTWLSEVTGERIMLPTEAQWQYAAQGSDGRAYPWGKNWDCKRCQNSVSPCDANQTALVTAYEGRDKGDSPFGVVQMAGNVWEWCLTAYESGSNDINSTDVRVLRGGSWNYVITDLFRCDYRSGDYPFNRGDYRGFRLARS